MPNEVPRIVVEASYQEAARDYLRRLPREHFAESTKQATQREITLESLDLVQAQRPDVHVFNELLVQYPVPRRKRPGQVVPDNMVVIHPEPIKADWSFDLPLQPARPFWMLDYVSKTNKRKDYAASLCHYEHDLKVPYYLLFVPDSQEMTLYHHTGEKYVSVKPNEQGRYAIPELEIEVGLHDGWMRYWFCGELLPLPAELQSELAKTREALAKTREALVKERQVSAKEHQARATAEQEVARLRAALEQLKGHQGLK